MQAHEGMDALVFNLRQEHVVICDFVSTFHQVCHSQSSFWLAHITIAAMHRDSVRSCRDGAYCNLG